MFLLTNLLKFKVVTLDQSALAAASRDLAEISRGFHPQLIVGIRTGGFTVAELMRPNCPDAVLLPFTCRRPSTGAKEKSSLLKDVIRNLPRKVNDMLRIAEHIALTQLRAPKVRAFTPNAAELDAIVNWVTKNGGNSRILIVDDSVDSGATLLAVRDALAAALPAATIKTAALTVTTFTPLISPDYSLYTYVLCRFPWSLDFKG